MRKLIVLGLMWGWSFFFIKIALQGMTPSAVVLGRLIFGAAIVVLSLLVTRTGLPRRWEVWKHLVFMALVTNVVPFSLFAWAQERITSSLTSVLNASTALMAAIVATIFLGEKLKGSQAAGLVLGFLGVGIAAGLGAGDVAGSSLTGTLAGLGAAFCYAIGFAYSQHHDLGARPEATTAGQLLIGAAVMAPFGVGTSITHGIALTPTRFLAVFILGVFGTGVGYLIYYRMIAEVGAARASIVTYLVPVVGLVVGVTVADEPFSWRLVIGGLLIVGGVIAVQGNLPAWMKGKGPGVLAALTALVGMGLGGCAAGEPESQDTTTSSTAASAAEGCGNIVEEKLDPQSGRHLLPGAPVPSFLSDPPTSGAHTSGGAWESGVVAEPIDPPTQVQILEGGLVLIQFASGQLTSDEVDDLAVLAETNEQIVVAPHDSLPAPVVATAWVHKMLCEDVDTKALTDFAARFAGQGGADH
ncbi:MAG TPA: EamA family transporter [Acidimicrobiales bacterium]|nr:EamA family transporter [Acidimicrobiales bacterium]